jgi:hypothetical protein
VLIPSTSSGKHRPRFDTRWCAGYKVESTDGASRYVGTRRLAHAAQPASDTLTM